MKIEKNTKGRDFIVGDLHGCYDLLITELNKVAFSYVNDRLFSVGDLIDRGKQNLECLDLLGADWFFAVRGNHEDMMIDAVMNDRNIDHWLRNGGKWSFDIEERILVDYCNLILDKMPYTIELETYNGMAGISHAEPMGSFWTDDFGEYTKQQIVWGRNWINKTRDMSVTNMYKTYHGHTVIPLPKQVGNTNFIDTGAVFNGNLTLMEIK